MSTRSPRHVEQLYFLLCQKPTVRSAENLEIRHTFSLEITSPNSLHLTRPATARFVFLEKMNTVHLLSYSINNSKFPFMSAFVLILTLDTISTIHFHHLSNLVTCVTKVHVVGDFCHITCLSNPFYGTRHPMP